VELASRFPVAPTPKSTRNAAEKLRKVLAHSVQDYLMFRVESTGTLNVSVTVRTPHGQDSAAKLAAE
jgi:hypothetical protein